MLKFAPPEKKPDLLIIAGEHSGDQHAARLLMDVQLTHPELTVCALGGPELARAGAQLLYDLTASSVVGFVEVLKNYGFFKKLFAAILAWIDDHRPKAICFVDYPGFNLRVAKRLYDTCLAAKAGGDIRLLYYIGPQIWAWKAKRRFAMARLLDSLAVIFPFEVSCYQDTDLDVHFVGHPFVQSDYRLPLRYDPMGPVLLLPGSRTAPVKRIFPLMLAGFKRWLEHAPQDRAVVVYPSPTVLAVLQEKLNAIPELVKKVEFVAQHHEVAAKAVMTSSGTMSLNCILAGIPGLIVYKANGLTYFIGRQLVKIPFLGIANILLDKPVYPEYLQEKAHSENLFQALQDCQTDGRLRAISDDAQQVRTLLHAEQNYTSGEWLGRFL